MADAKRQEVKLVEDPSEGLGFKVVDAQTGRELSRAEVKELQAVYPPPHAGKAKSLSASSVKLCGEGDSWLNLLSHISGFPKTLFDILGETFPARNLAFPGDTFDEVLAAKQYKSVLQSGLYKVFIFSGGGNDILGGGGLTNLLRKKSDGHGSAIPADYVNQPVMAEVMGRLGKGYRKVAKEAKTFEPGILMLTHGYDHALPRKNGKWLGTPLQAKGYAHDDAVSPKIIAYLVDHFNDVLASVAHENAHVRHIDVRGAVNGRWHDELHPNELAARDIAKLFAKQIKTLLVS